METGNKHSKQSRDVINMASFPSPDLFTCGDLFAPQLTTQSDEI